MIFQIYVYLKKMNYYHCVNLFIETFDSRRKMGGEEFSAKYRDKLEGEMNEAFENYKSHNESKNLFRAANTPITLGAIAMILYILSQLFSIFGLYPIANILNLKISLVQAKKFCTMGIFCSRV